MDSELKEKLILLPDLIGGQGIIENDRYLKVYYFNPFSFTDIMDAEVKDYGNEAEGFTGKAADLFSRAAGTIGMVDEIAPSFAKATLIQIAAPIAKSVILFVIITILPLTFIISKLEWKWVVGIHTFIFSVMLWPIFWDLSILAQQSFIEETISDSSVPLWSMLTQPNIMMISKLLTDGMFLAFPLLLTSLLTAAGMQGGGSMGNMTTAGGDAGSAGAKGGKKATSKETKGKAQKAFTKMKTGGVK